MELKEAKRELERNGYQRKLVYKLSYQKEDGTWKYIFFDDKEEAYAMIDEMQKINAKVMTYHYISFNKWTWEMFLEP